MEPYEKSYREALAYPDEDVKLGFWGRLRFVISAVVGAAMLLFYMITDR